MKQEFLRIAGVKNEREFYKKFPTEEAFFNTHPQANSLVKKKGGGTTYSGGVWYKDGGMPCYQCGGKYQAGDEVMTGAMSMLQAAGAPMRNYYNDYIYRSGLNLLNQAAPQFIMNPQYGIDLLKEMTLENSSYPSLTPNPASRMVQPLTLNGAYGARYRPMQGSARTEQRMNGGNIPNYMQDINPLYNFGGFFPSGNPGDPTKPNPGSLDLPSDYRARWNDIHSYIRGQVGYDDANPKAAQSKVRSFNETKTFVDQYNKLHPETPFNTDWIPYINNELTNQIVPSKSQMAEKFGLNQHVPEKGGLENVIGYRLLDKANVYPDMKLRTSYGTKALGIPGADLRMDEGSGYLGEQDLSNTGAGPNMAGLIPGKVYIDGKAVDVKVSDGQGYIMRPSGDVLVYDPKRYDARTGRYRKDGGLNRFDMGGNFIPYPSLNNYIPSLSEMKRGGIHIDPSKRGTFTAAATKAGMGVQAFANKVLSAPEGKFSPAMRKKANFARNASKWKEEGGLVEGQIIDVTPDMLEQLKLGGYTFEIVND